MNKQTAGLTNRELMLPYAVPYFAYVGIASLGHDRLSEEVLYISKIIIVPLLLWWGWKWYVPITGPLKKSGSIFYGLIFGLVGLVGWCLLLAPFVELDGEPWSVTGFWLRMSSAALIVPIFEEMFIRGFIYRLAYQWDQFRKEKKGALDALENALDHASIDTVPPGAWTVPTILLSTIAFTVGHTTPEWPAAIFYSVLISILWIIRKDLLSCMVAHGVTNLTLALYVYKTGSWGLW